MVRFPRSLHVALRRPEIIGKGHGVRALACDFHFRADQGGKLKLELHALLLRSTENEDHKGMSPENVVCLSVDFIDRGAERRGFPEEISRRSRRSADRR